MEISVAQILCWQAKITPFESICSGAVGTPYKEVSMLCCREVLLIFARLIAVGRGRESPRETSQAAVTRPRLLKIAVA